jgi:hypothetical protein
MMPLNWKVPLAPPIRPASILLQPARAVAASLVEQSLPDIFPDGMRSIKSDRIRLLYFDDPSAADAFDAQHVSRNFREAALLDRQRWPAGGARIGQYGIREAIAAIFTAKMEHPHSRL